MALVRFNQPSSVFPYRNLLNELLNDFNTSVGQDYRSNIPAVNVHENETGYTLEVAAPGQQKENFNINLDGRVLTISSEQKEEKKEENGKWTRKEFNYSSFKRSFTLPENVNAENIEATYENGVLVVVVPKAEEVKPKSIAIK
ncbi:Hsp20/alpha crystallin family protein [Cytophagaceae bacterium DM2B3-1]|uniref:Hsp20/alpha crystallin family protein n=1 Tax=Xanthocytophaga flava TaxID=3048013 RepID=A0ABT7CHX5_9BACT|nr:Hsp20/alpha crystallin family protein [Xanthocytophaga flavus]MDJ1472268.1 Hsp20/alpha crystallin family protein [Xanthocytophaga flavus]MDJ1492279.1 Hsp20/alpha crystallin family protein [Xanthocytophaga flavus]